MPSGESRKSKAHEANGGAQAVAELLESYYADIENAFATKDHQRIADYLAPEFMGYDTEGKMRDRQTLLEYLKGHFESIQFISWPRRVTSIKLEGDIATAIVQGKFTASLVDSCGTKSKIELGLVNTDVWRRTDQGWLFVSTTPKK